MTEGRHRVAVVGGGIAGLAAGAHDELDEPDDR